MDTTLEKHFEQYFELFRTQGWKNLIEDIMDEVTALDTLEGVSTQEDLYYKKGKLFVLKGLLSLEDITQRQFEEAQE